MVFCIIIVEVKCFLGSPSSTNSAWSYGSLAGYLLIILILIDLSGLDCALGLESLKFPSKGFSLLCHGSTRLKITVGAAKGLAFLHGAEKPVIYHDFKASNILLDLDYTAKLSDFGLAKDGPEGEDTHVTTRVMGTQGYAAPEYIMTGHLTAKSDVYSFGVLPLELLTGRQSIDKTRPSREWNLVGWSRPYLKNADKLGHIIDPNLEGQYSSKGAQRAAAVAYQCLSQSPKSRPHMRDIVETLEPLLNLNDIPIGPLMYMVMVEKSKEEDEGKMEMKVDAKVKQDHRNHDRRHKLKFPNSAIHSEATLHREGRNLYRNSPRHHQG